jgi:hypothetical protein
MQDPMQRPKLEVVLRAMEISASKFPNEGIAPDAISPTWSDDFTRRWVVSTAMDCLSVENLQALIIIAFNDVSSLKN